MVLQDFELIKRFQTTFSIILLKYTICIFDHAFFFQLWVFYELYDFINFI